MKEEIRENRLQNLLFLIEQYKTIANLNVALGRKRKDGTLSQIKNKAIVPSTGKSRTMGTALARDIEARLRLPSGWMDKFHKEIQPLRPDLENIQSPVITPLNENNTESIPLYEIVTTEFESQLNTRLKGEIQLTNLLVNAMKQSEKAELVGYLTSDNAMYKTMPRNSIAIVDRAINSFAGDGVYLIQTNGKPKFRNISELIDGRLIIKSDLLEEVVDNKEQIDFLGKVKMLWECKPL